MVDSESFDSLKLAASGRNVWEEWGDAWNEVSRRIIDNVVVLYRLVETVAKLVQVLSFRGALSYLSYLPGGLACFLRGAKRQFSAFLP